MIDKVVESYRTYLEVKHLVKLKLFDRNLASHPSGARAEAALFGFLRKQMKHASVLESPSVGGPDFLCEDSTGEFVVEVTAFDDEAVARAASWPNIVPTEDEADKSFTMVTDKLLNTARDKQRQLSAATTPRVLVIASEHVGAGVLLSDYAAEALIVGDTKPQITGVRSASPRVDIAAALSNSVFLKPAKDGHIAPARQSISAILLAAVSESGVSMLGALHPKPTIEFDQCHFPEVAFAKLREWNETPTSFAIDWVICNPRPREYVLSEVELTDDELRAK